MIGLSCDQICWKGLRCLRSDVRCWAWCRWWPQHPFPRVPALTMLAITIPRRQRKPEADSRATVLLVSLLLGLVFFPSRNPYIASDFCSISSFPRFDASNYQLFSSSIISSWSTVVCSQKPAQRWACWGKGKALVDFNQYWLLLLI